MTIQASPEAPSAPDHPAPEGDPGRRRKLFGVVAAVGAVGMLLCVGFTPTLFSSVVEGMRESARNAREGCGALGFTVDDTVKIEGLASDQLRNAATIVGVGQQMRVPPRGWVIALATALQESSLRNYDRAVDHDSLGLFQQRPSSGWGNLPAHAQDRRTPQQRILDPKYAAARFYEKLLRTPNWERRRLTEVAQIVQISAHPERYARWEPFATLLVNRLTKGAANGVTGQAGDPVQCAAPGQVTGAGWTVPAAGQVGSGFRTPERPGHAGVDVISPRYTVIRAASAGVVITAVCNSSSGTCDVDGSPAVKGCGWYVEISHGAGITTRYCHMVQKPWVTVGQRVAAGQALGRVGSSGNSSGPHLHFEVRHNGTAVNPVPFLAARGAPFGGRT